MKKILTTLLMIVPLIVGAQSEPAILGGSETKAWYVAEIEYMTLDEGNVTVWADKSANGYNLWQPTPGIQYLPTFSNGMVTFGNDLDQLENLDFVAENQPITAYLVARFNNYSQTGYRGIFDFDNISAWEYNDDGSVIAWGLKSNWVGGNLLASEQNKLPKGEFVVLAVTFNGNNSSIRLNNNTRDLGGTFSNSETAARIILSHNAMDMDVKEFIVRAADDSDTDEDAIVNWLMTKYNIGGLGGDIGGDYYVATDGSDSNPGTYDLPFATWQKAVDVAIAGDTVYIRGGVYYSERGLIINPERYGGPRGASGTRENPICFFGYPGEWPILDCINHCAVAAAEGQTNVYNSAISIEYAEHIKFKDFEVRNVYQCGPVVTGGITSGFSRYLSFEHIILHDVGQRGFYIASGAWQSHYEEEVLKDPTFPVPYFNTPDDTTYFINCDVYNLCDTLTGGGASDGWITMSYRGNYIEWRGCRAWDFSDDGNNPTLSNGGTLIIDSCWWMAGDKYENTDFGGVTERNGMKLNGVGQDYYIMTPADPYSYITNNIIAFSNVGYYVLENPGRGNFRFHNNLAYSNMTGYQINSGGTAVFPHSAEFYNNIEYGSWGSVSGGGYSGVYIAHDNGYCYEESNNTWICSDGYPYADLNPAFNVTAADFVNLNDTEIWNQLTAPRKPDGSLPDITALQLAPTSELIDAGIDVGIPYNGSAPDLGPLEYSTAIGANPTASFTATPTIINVGQSIAFNASASTDSDGTITNYAWNFGNGTGTGVTANRTYSTAGDYTVSLTVTDNDNNSASTNQTITVNAVQVPTGIHDNATLVSAMAIAQPGDTIRLSSDAFTGDIVFSCSGTSVNPVVILPDATFTPVFSGNATVTGDHVTLRELTFNGGIELTSFDTDLIYCNINSTLNLNQCTSPTVTNNTFTGTGTVLTFTLPRGITKGRNWIIDYNIYNVGSGARFQGYSYGIYRANYYNFDVNSTITIAP